MRKTFLIFFFFLPLFLHSQVLDTMRDPNISASDSINKIIRTRALLDGVEVLIQTPRRGNKKGVKVRYGTKKYYLHVLKCKEIIIEGEPLKFQGKRTYLLVSSPMKILPYRMPDSISLRAQYIKGMVDNLDSLIKAKRKEIRKIKRERDSLKIVIGEANFWTKIKRVFVKVVKKDTISQETRDSIRLEIKKRNKQIKTRKKDLKIYRQFKRKKRGKSAPKFFTRHYFRKGFKYDVYGQVYGLPVFVEQHVWEPVVSNKVRRKKIKPPVKKERKIQIIFKKKGSNWEKR